MAEDMFARLLGAPGQSRSARTVEVFGWIMLAEAPLVLLAPHTVAAVLHLPLLSEHAANYFRLVGLLLGGLGMLYVVTGIVGAVPSMPASGSLDSTLGWNFSTRRFGGHRPSSDARLAPEPSKHSRHNLGRLTPITAYCQTAIDGVNKIGFVRHARLMIAVRSPDTRPPGFLAGLLRPVLGLCSPRAADRL